MTELAEQKELERVFMNFLKELEGGFNAVGDEMPDTFWRQMSVVKDAIISVWESGYCPQWK